MAKPDKKEDDWEDIEDPNFFRFENIGDKVSGKLVDIGNSERYNFGLYTIEQEDGTQMRFHGSAHLDSRMKQCQIGDHVKVEFIDVEEQDKGDMKLYDVKRKRGKGE